VFGPVPFIQDLLREGEMIGVALRIESACIPSVAEPSMHFKSSLRENRAIRNVHPGYRFLRQTSASLFVSAGHFIYQNQVPPSADPASKTLAFKPKPRIRCSENIPDSPPPMMRTS
jgi:hypothetical protein